jgi:hypothetical protein
MRECLDCEVEFEPVDLICADSAEKVTECTLENHTCVEVYCSPCFN